MTETKTFPIVAVLMTVTGRCLVERGIEGVYLVLNWMTGESVFTHQIPRISKEAVPVILAMHPTLQQAIDESEQVNGENYLDWVATWTDRYGDTMAVPKMDNDQHERIDPLSELAEKVHPDKIIVIGEPS